MLTEIVMPQLSLSMQVGTVIEWYKAEGEPVAKGEMLCEIEGDKATIAIDAPVSGILKKIVAARGDEFPVKQVMAYIGAPEDTVPGSERAAPSPSAAAGPAAASPAAASTQAASVPPQAAAASGRASPVAKRLAAELGVDLALVVGTGPDGLIGKDDVLRAKAAQEQTAAAPVQAAPTTAAAQATLLEVEQTLPVAGVKKRVGERMLASHRDVPHIHLTVKCVVTEAMAARRALNASLGDRAHVTVTDMLLWAAGRALATHRHFNSAFQDGAIQLYRQINLGVAIASERGLIVGVLPSAEALNLVELAQRRQEVVERVAAGRQTPADTTNATFTLTNLGMLGVLAFDPIVPPGNAAILGAGKVTKELLVDDAGQMRIEETLLLTLACDHRAVDGADGARFLADLVAALEQPQALFGGLS